MLHARAHWPAVCLAPSAVGTAAVYNRAPEHIPPAHHQCRHEWIHSCDVGHIICLYVYSSSLPLVLLRVLTLRLLTGHMHTCRLCQRARQVRRRRPAQAERQGGWGGASGGAGLAAAGCSVLLGTSALLWLGCCTTHIGALPNPAGATACPATVTVHDQQRGGPGKTMSSRTAHARTAPITCTLSPPPPCCRP